jgi:hypothetical protein
MNCEPPSASRGAPTEDMGWGDAQRSCGVARPCYARSECPGVPVFGWSLAVFRHDQRTEQELLRIAVGPQLEPGFKQCPKEWPSSSGSMVRGMSALASMSNLSESHQPGRFTT